ncbi:MAG TPA: glycosyltransferase family A protein [Nitrospirales bacterium]|nr:glycosyltransferase family A protein [Nitrospirales bacterium]
MGHKLNFTEQSIVRLPLVSVVVPVYNAAKFLTETLNSILCQTYKQIEVIAVNDGSTDSSRDILKEFSGRIHWIDQENYGVAIARNVGIAHSRGNFVAFCDADDIWFPEKIECQMDLMHRHPDVGVVGGLLENIDELGRKIEPCLCYLDLYNKPINLRQILLMEGNVNGIDMSTAIIRKNVLEKIQGFDPEHKHLKAEDYDFWIRISNQTKFYLPYEYFGQYRVLRKSRSHGSLRKEYSAQFQILQMYRNEYSLENYNIRKAKIYSEWAESSFVVGEKHAWKLQAKAMKLHPANLYHQVRFGWGLIKHMVKSLVRPFQGNIGFRKDIG